MKLIKFFFWSLMFSFAFSTVCAADDHREDWLTYNEKKYSVRKFDSVKVSNDCEIENEEHAFLYSKEYPDFIFFVGPICGSLSENFFEISTEYPEAKHLILNSEGGVVKVGLQFGKLVSEMGFSTVIPSNSECHSACGTVFMGGAKR